MHCCVAVAKVGELDRHAAAALAGSPTRVGVCSSPPSADCWHRINHLPLLLLQFRDSGCGCVSGLAKAFSAAVIDITTPGLQGGKLPRVVVVVGRVRDAYMPGVNVCLRRAALLSKHACSCYKRACLLPGTHPPPPALAAVALLATACSCPACAALQPAANGTSPPAAPVVQAADKPAP